MLEATCTSNTANTDIAEAASTPAHDSNVIQSLDLGTWAMFIVKKGRGCEFVVDMGEALC